MPKQKSLKANVEAMVARIPSGRVMTYGQLAALSGSPRASRVVGGIAHYGDVNVPWHRVVNKQGRLASGYHGGRGAQKVMLEAEGVQVRGSDDTYFVDVEKLLWWPEASGARITDK